MQFTLKLVPALPNEVVLGPEKPLSGIKFLEEAGKILRRNLDCSAKCKHQTLGVLSTYNISVPQQIAIESGWFEDKSERYLTVENGLLNYFIFHTAMFSYGAGNRTYYPYYQNEIVLSSYIDELRFVEVWRNRGYPDRMTKNLNPGVDIPLVDDAEDVTDQAQEGDLVLDDLSDDLFN